MKKISIKSKLNFIVLCLVIFLSMITLRESFSQVSMNYTRDMPDSSAMLDIQSTTGGFLPPRMTTEERDAIVAPANGLLVYNISNGHLEFFVGGEWRMLKYYPYAIGTQIGGGIVFYNDTISGESFISPTIDQDSNVAWVIGNFIKTGATFTAIGLGQINTTAIVTSQGVGNYAGKLCDSAVINSFSDFFLPSKDELNQMYLQRGIIGGFKNNSSIESAYWSSSEVDTISANIQYFFNGLQESHLKNTPINVRCIRKIKYQ